LLICLEQFSISSLSLPPPPPPPPPIIIIYCGIFLTHHYEFNPYPANMENMVSF
jgi:hypothetical protein